MGLWTSHLVANPLLGLRQTWIAKPTHEPCKLSSFSIYMQQCPYVAFVGIIVATIATTTIGELQIMVVIHSTLSLLYHQPTTTQEKVEEIKRWGMMQMGHLQT
jgi:hypothetical protein